ncbi:Qat anti-phage system TatD family nuclease QatD [Variovorax sp. H27-G14]|uniref:Qat anti-phage system TatD family nuclease QatD n=1 Tax=Variovorax sp. H27-G14 TaxID=3111914 RepID=UPI0038FC02A0
MIRMRPRWVDFHCHLDLYPDHASLVSECDRERVATLAVTTTPKAWKRNLEVATGSEYVRVALGMHPQLIAERASELPLFEKLLSETRYVGEIGLDAGPKFYRSFSEQERVFSRILGACAEQGNKILTIHSVRCVSKVLDHLERSFPLDRGVAVLHWFTGTAAEARRAAELGCYFSINAQMLVSEKTCRVVSALPRERLLTETDGPFVAFNERPSRPRDVGETLKSLASTLGIEVQAASELVVKNLGALTRNRNRRV